MTIENDSIEKRRMGPSTCVRFTDTEYLKVKKMQLETGRSIPWMLKQALLSNDLRFHPLDAETRQFVRRQMAYMGNNMNQAAKAVNSGLTLTAEECLFEVRTSLRALLSFLGLTHGDRKNTL